MSVSDRRKFRRQTSDNVTDEKQRSEESEKRREEKRREEKKKEDQKESLRRKKIQVRETVGGRETLCFSNDLISIIAIFNPRS
jgi:hypothetical protein